jgi:hypothetical protein
VAAILARGVVRLRLRGALGMSDSAEEGIMEFSGGRLLRDARFFFIALIIVEAFADGVSTVVRTISGGAVPAF